jgi:hypothetical protein
MTQSCSLFSDDVTRWRDDLPRLAVRSTRRPPSRLLSWLGCPRTTYLLVNERSMRTCEHTSNGGGWQEGGGRWRRWGGGRGLGRTRWDAWRRGSPSIRPRATPPPSIYLSIHPSPGRRRGGEAEGGRGAKIYRRVLGSRAARTKPKTAENRARAIENSS